MRLIPAALLPAPTAGHPATPDHLRDPDERLRDLAGSADLTLFRAVDSGPRGLTETEAELRADAPRPVPSRARERLGRLRDAVRGPFVLLLAGLCATFALLGDVRGTATVGTMALAAVALRFWQATRSQRAVAALRDRLHTTVTVLRRADDGFAPVEREVPTGELVAGDVVVLRAGDVVPADLRVLSSHRLLVDQSALSGETLPVAKRGPSGADRPRARTAAARRALAVSTVELPSLCFAGTSVVGGHATALVLATGDATHAGTAARAAAAPRRESSVDRGVRDVVRTLVRFTLVLVPLVLAVSGLARADWTEAALYAAAVAVGLTPEMLPVIVTTTLARGASRLARDGVVATRLDAIQDLGAMDLLCLDKTGTITADDVAYAHSVDADGRPDGEAAELAFLAVHLQDAVPDRLDEAVADRLAGVGERLLAEAVHTRVDELPFDPDRRRASVLLRRGGEHVLVVKGDPDVLLPRCTSVRRGGETVELTDPARRAAGRVAATSGARGMRVLAVAVRTWDERPGHITGHDEDGLTLAGFVGFVDPVRDGTAAAVRELRAHGVAVTMLTGDNRHVAARVAAQAGIGDGPVVTGAALRCVTDRRLARILRDHPVVAGLTPDQKARIVTVLRADGRTVGFAGDGVNDAAALRAADVGIAVRNATDVAKDAADLVLTGPGLDAVARGVPEGRRTLGNGVKYVLLTAASNAGNVLTVLVASALLPFPPMLPLQLMVQNLLYDAAQLALPWDRVPERWTRSPRRWDASGLARFMLVFGPISSLFDLATFAVLWWGLGAGAHPDVFRTGWFVEGLLSQLLAVLVLRGRVTAGRSRPDRRVLLATAAVALLGTALPFVPPGAALGLVPLPPAYAGWLAVLLAGYVLVLRLAARTLR